MTAAAGLALGIGLFLIWWSCWVLPERPAKVRRPGRIEELLRASGISRVTPAGLVLSSALLGMLVLLTVWVLTAFLGAGNVLSAAAAFAVYAAADLICVGRERNRTDAK